MQSTYISSNQFRIDSDKTLEFLAGRRIKATCGVDGTIYSTIQSSSYSAPYTTVTITENVLTSNLTEVLYGIVNIGTEGSFPNHTHSISEGQGSQIDFANLTNKTFNNLSDTPSIYEEGKYLRATTSGLEFVTISGEGDVTQEDLANYVTWDFGSDTISGTGDIYCKDIYTYSNSVYIGNLKLSSNNDKLLINDSEIVGTPGIDGKDYDEIQRYEIQCGFSVYHQTDPAVDYTVSAGQKYPANNIHFDTDNGWSTTNYEYVIPKAGLWIFTLSLYTNTSPTTSSRRIFICQERDSSDIANEQTGQYASGRPHTIILSCEVGDIIYVHPSTFSFDYHALAGHNRFSGALLNMYGGVTNNFIDLKDTPTTYLGSSGKYLRATTSGLEFATISGIDELSPTTFLELTDTPFSYTAGKYLRTTASGVEFANLATIPSDFKSYEIVAEWDFNNEVVDKTLTIDGDTDDTWRVETYYYNNGATESKLLVQFNDDSTSSNYPYYFTGSSTGDSTDVGAWINNSASGAYSSSIAELFLKSGNRRIVMERDYRSNTQSFNINTTWTNTADNITSMKFISASSISGYIRVYKLKQVDLPVSGSSLATFIELNDTPTTYSGSSGKYLRATASGIDFVSMPEQVISNFRAYEIIEDITLNNETLDVTVSGISGDTDDVWFVDFDLLNKHTTGNAIVIVPNSDTNTNNYSYSYSSQYSSNSWTASYINPTNNIPGLSISYIGDVNGTSYATGFARVFTKSGKYRCSLSNANSYSSVPHHSLSYASKWHNTSSEITTMRLQSIGNLIGTVRLYKFKKVNLLDTLYTPANSSDWNGNPVTFKEAIDRIAAEVAILKGSAIS